MVLIIDFTKKIVTFMLWTRLRRVRVVPPGEEVGQGGETPENESTAGNKKQNCDDNADNDEENRGELIGLFDGGG